jgi:transcriptional regulator with XRE-family HTH domain
MSWWFKVPAAFGLRPEMMEVGMAGLHAWMALLAIDAQNDFAGEVPRRFCAPSYLARQFPDDGPGADEMERGITRCLDAKIVVDTGDGLRFADDVYEGWRAPKSDRQRKRDQRAKEAPRQMDKYVHLTVADRAGHAESRDVTAGHAMSRPVTQVTLPDQTRPDQTRESTHTSAGTRAHAEGSGPAFAAEREALGIAGDEAAKALGFAPSELAQLEAGDRQPSQAEANELELLIRRARGEVHVGLDETRPVLRRERRDVAKALWAYQDKVRAQVVPDARPLKLQEMPGGQLDPIVLLLATWSPADCRHALDMAAEEARVLGASGKDPLVFLNGRTNWKQEQFERLCQATPEQIRARAGPRLQDQERKRAGRHAVMRGSSRRPASLAELQEAERQLANKP